MRHFPATELKLDPDLIATIEEFFPVTDLGQIIMIVDVYPELDLLQLGAGRFLILVLLGNVVTKFSKGDDFTNWGVRSGCDFNQIQIETLRFAQGIRKLHDA